MTFPYLKVKISPMKRLKQANLDEIMYLSRSQNLKGKYVMRYNVHFICCEIFVTLIFLNINFKLAVFTSKMYEREHGVYDVCLLSEVYRVRLQYKLSYHNSILLTGLEFNCMIKDFLDTGSS